ncbi:Rha family transcriptional regulator [Shewanella sp. A32]|uniref:Rha family transcriptional regulator n=1 Tax=Shewanella sp. A32 TaxID=3031327 RepID=UPI0023B9A83B|nr:Rha family transcriptional regulator [Shewanella sp. A32]MDF0533663.1 Rha family transcriptional regulator [Shewanella sp. A32]
MISPIIPAKAVTRSNGEVKTTSLKVAEAFNKQHKDVLRKLESLDCSPDFASAHFYAHVENQQVGIAKRDMKYYEMTKDGFMFLVMGFTGKQAAAIKEAYINAFNQMASQLRRPRHNTNSERTLRLRQAMSLLVTKKSIPYPAGFNIIHHRFDVNHINELTDEQMPQAVEYVHHLALDGEWMPPSALPAPEPEKVLQYNTEDLYQFALLLQRADWMRRYINDILPLLKVAEHRLYGALYEHAATARLDINRCIPLIEREFTREHDDIAQQLSALLKRLHA